ncbi:hypothetical protein GCM10007853_27490 [Algimonas ampicilliniresistens]|jgi:hypothetical protein|uniref:Glycine zipper 2TM domain-containing protein n=1 Tax=Algimonas ampicilliniresistens TaxID=1298735 RepID=A0ABQ5VDU3_9PROT|nr:hypothetical protein [Algimonas ampicilliniresistens]GLQ24875.1 hypothetical protein GCM10007853_27490 [Algimonas ampicilliniresistens]
MRNTFTKSLAAVSLAAAALALPTVASAGDYRKCKDTEATIAGGLIGGSLGTVLGEEIAGHGDKTEGAIAGAVIGGIIGAAIGDGASDCEKDGRIYRNGRVISTYQNANYRQPAYQTVGHNGHQTRSRGHRPHHRGYDDRQRQSSYGYSSRQHDRDLRRIDRRIDRLRDERRDLKQRQRYERRGRWIQRRLNEISYELDHLKDERRRVKRAYDNRRDRRDYRPRNRRGHYHGQTVCYSDH